MLRTLWSLLSFKTEESNLSSPFLKMRKTDNKKSENGKIKANLKSLQEEKTKLKKKNHSNPRVELQHLQLKHHAANCRELLQFRFSQCLLAVHYDIIDM